MGEPVLETDVIAAASLLDSALLRVLVPRGPAKIIKQAVRTLVQSSQSAEDWVCLTAISFDSDLVEQGISDCLVTKKYSLLELFLKWVLLTYPSDAMLEGDICQAILAELSNMPAPVRSVLIPRCVWKPEQLPDIARLCSYNVLIDAIRANVRQVHKLDNNFLGAWYFWVQPLDENFLCAMHYMAARGDAERISFALESDAPIVSVSKQKNTPLHMVSGIGEPEATIELLVRNGADLNMRNDQGHTPVDLWRNAGKQEWIDIAARVK
jgi:hypothetical protein